MLPHARSVASGASPWTRRPAPPPPRPRSPPPGAGRGGRRPRRWPARRRSPRRSGCGTGGSPGPARRGPTGPAGGTRPSTPGRRWPRPPAWCARTASGAGNDGRRRAERSSRPAPSPSAPITSPTGLQATRAPTVASPTRTAAVPSPPGTAYSRPRHFPTVAPRPAPMAARHGRLSPGGVDGGRPALPPAPAPGHRQVEQRRGHHDRHRTRPRSGSPGPARPGTARRRRRRPARRPTRRSARRRRPAPPAGRDRAVPSPGWPAPRPGPRPSRPSPTAPTRPSPRCPARSSARPECRGRR